MVMVVVPVIFGLDMWIHRPWPGPRTGETTGCNRSQVVSRISVSRWLSRWDRAATRASRSRSRRAIINAPSKEEMIRVANSFESTDLASAMRRAAAAHGKHEKRNGQHDANWPDWYAVYMAAEQAGTELPR